MRTPVAHSEASTDQYHPARSPATRGDKVLVVGLFIIFAAICLSTIYFTVGQLIYETACDFVQYLQDLLR